MSNVKEGHGPSYLIRMRASHNKLGQHKILKEVISAANFPLKGHKRPLTPLSPSLSAFSKPLWAAVPPPLNGVYDDSNGLRRHRNISEEGIG